MDFVTENTNKVLAHMDIGKSQLWFKMISSLISQFYFFTIKNHYAENIEMIKHPIKHFKFSSNYFFVQLWLNAETPRACKSIYRTWFSNRLSSKKTIVNTSSPRMIRICKNVKFKCCCIFCDAVLFIFRIPFVLFVDIWIVRIIWHIISGLKFK